MVYGPSVRLLGASTHHERRIDGANRTMGSARICDNEEKPGTMKAIVTGGAGFIGSHLSEILISKGMAVTILDNLSTGRIENINTVNDKVKFIECDLSKATSEWTDEIKDADYIYHLASLADIVPSIEKPRDYFDSNVVATLNILEACREANIKKLVYAASSSCYGRNAPTPTHENETINPEYPYA